MKRSTPKHFFASYLGSRSFRGAAQEVRHLHELEREGESEWTPWIAVAGLVLFFLACGLLMVGIAEAASYLLSSAFFAR
jgi:hypothetical protein